MNKHLTPQELEGKPLTERELEIVVALVKHGADRSAVCSEPHIQIVVPSLKTHLRRIAYKMGIAKSGDRISHLSAKIIAEAYKRGLVKTDREMQLERENLELRRVLEMTRISA